MRRKRSMAVYSLLEFTIALVLFACCAAICVSLQAQARNKAAHSMQLRQAMQEANNLITALQVDQEEHMGYAWEKHGDVWTAPSLYAPGVEIILEQIPLDSHVYGNVSVIGEQERYLTLPFTIESKEIQ